MKQNATAAYLMTYSFSFSVFFMISFSVINSNLALSRAYAVSDHEPNFSQSSFSAEDPPTSQRRRLPSPVLLPAISPTVLDIHQEPSLDKNLEEGITYYDLKLVHDCIKIGEIECLIRLIDRFPQALNSLDSHGQNLFHIAALSNQPCILEVLRYYMKYEQLFENDKSSGKYSPLHLAARTNKPEAVQYLLEILPPEAIWIRDGKGKTALEEAASKGHWDIVLLFLGTLGNQAYKKDIKGNNFLHHAALNGALQSMPVGFLQFIEPLALEGKNLSGAEPHDLIYFNRQNRI
jgi:hypothetical protein